MAELKEEFQDLFCLRVIKRTVHLDIYTKLNPLVCFHRIYQGSIFLRLLCYFLREEKESFLQLKAIKPEKVPLGNNFQAIFYLKISIEQLSQEIQNKILLLF